MPLPRVPLTLDDIEIGRKYRFANENYPSWLGTIVEAINKRISTADFVVVESHGTRPTDHPAGYRTHLEPCYFEPYELSQSELLFS